MNSQFANMRKNNINKIGSKKKFVLNAFLALIVLAFLSAIFEKQHANASSETLLQQQGIQSKITLQQNLAQDMDEVIREFWKNFLGKFTDKNNTDVDNEKKSPFKSLHSYVNLSLGEWLAQIQNSQIAEKTKNLLGKSNYTHNPVGDYLALAHAEADQEFLQASEIASRVTAKIRTKQVYERAMLAHMRIGEFDKAIPTAKRLKKSNDVHGFIAKFVLASYNIQRGKYEEAREIIGDLSGFGDFVRYGAPTYRFWTSFALNDTHGEKIALRELEKEALNEFAQLMRFYAALARKNSKNTREILRERSRANSKGEESLSLMWAKVTHHAVQGEKDVALAQLKYFRTPLQARSLFLDEIAQRIENENYEQWLPSNNKKIAAFFLARSLADLASAERSPGAKLMLARLAQQTDPNSGYAKLLLSETLSEFQQFDQALNIARQVKQKSLYYRQSLLQQAEILRKKELIDDAVDILEKMQSQNKNEAIASWYAASFLRIAGKHQQALQYFDQAIKVYEEKIAIEDGNMPEGFWRVLYERGISLERSGDWKRAERDFLNALKISPEQPMVMNYLAYSWLELKDDQRYQEALKMLQRAVTLRQRSGAITDSLGWAHYRLKDYDDAIEILEKAITFEPQDPTINDHLGDVYWQVGRQIEARYQWQRVLVLETKDQKLLQRVQKKIDNGLTE